MLKDKRRADPLLLRLALAQRALASREAADSTEQLRSRFEASRIRGDTLHMREEARYALHLLNDPVRALKLAQAEWRVQKEPADARILLEAALATGETAACTLLIPLMLPSRHFRRASESGNRPPHPRRMPSSRTD